MISVVIPLYNKEKQIVKTLQSVLQQTFQDFEVVIVNDGSTDGSVAAAEAVQDARIRIIHQENAGVSAARNRGITEAKYELIAFLDADDRWKPEYLQTQYELTQKYPECSVFACNYEFVHADGSVHPSIIRKLPFEEQDGILSNYFEVASCSHPPICSISIMARKDALHAVGGFPVGIKSGEDLLTWARLACDGLIAYSRSAEACFYEDSSHSISRRPSRPHDENDRVGEGLCSLLVKTSDAVTRRYLKRYISLWYKMRTSVCMRVGSVCGAWYYGLKTLWFSLLNVKVLVMMILVLIPVTVRLKILKYIEK